MEKKHHFSSHYGSLASIWVSPRPSIAHLSCRGHKEMPKMENCFYEMATQNPRSWPGLLLLTVAAAAMPTTAIAGLGSGAYAIAAYAGHGFPSFFSQPPPSLLPPSPFFLFLFFLFLLTDCRPWKPSWSSSSHSQCSFGPTLKCFFRASLFIFCCIAPDIHFQFHHFCCSSSQSSHSQSSQGPWLSLSLVGSFPSFLEACHHLLQKQQGFLTLPPWHGPCARQPPSAYFGHCSRHNRNSGPCTGRNNISQVVWLCGKSWFLSQTLLACGKHMFNPTLQTHMHTPQHSCHMHTAQLSCHIFFTFHFLYLLKSTCLCASTWAFVAPGSLLALNNISTNSLWLFLVCAACFSDTATTSLKLSPGFGRCWM